MKFKDLDCGNIFTWWDRDKHLVGCKVGERQAFCFSTLSLCEIHHNKECKEPERLPEDLILRFGRDGRAFLCSPLVGGNWLARCIILTTSEIISEERLKKQEKPKAVGGAMENIEQVYIMSKLLERKLHELEAITKTVIMMIDENMSQSSSDNNIMSTEPIIKGRLLPLE